MSISPFSAGIDIRRRQILASKSRSPHWNWKLNTWLFPANTRHWAIVGSMCSIAPYATWLSNIVRLNKKQTRKAREPSSNYHAGAPMGRVHVDILGPFNPPSTSGNRYVLVIVDQFTKWVECFPLPHQDAETVGCVFIDGLLARMGWALQVHTDQGAQFEGYLFRAVCELLDIVRKGNFDPWDESLKILDGAMQATRNKRTGFTPNMIMLGREVVKPLDMMFATML